MNYADDPAFDSVATFHAHHGGDFLTGDDTSDVDISWEYHAETASGQFTMIRNEQEYPNADGEMVEIPPVLIVRVVSYDEDEYVDPALMLVIEDDPNGFQKEVAALSVEFNLSEDELTFLLAEMKLPETPLQRVTLRATDDELRVLEDVTEMG